MSSRAVNAVDLLPTLQASSIMAPTMKGTHMADQQYTFGDLPPISRGRKREPQHTAFADQAKSHPGEWGQLGSGISGTAIRSINDGSWSEFAPAGTFEAKSRNVDAQGKGDVWVRFVGEDQAAIA